MCTFVRINPADAVEDFPDEVYEVALGLIPGVGIATTRLLVSYCGSPKLVFYANPSKLKSIPQIGDATVKSIREHKHEAISHARDIELKAKKLNTEIIFYTNPKYPKVLKNFDDSPTLLYYRGTSTLDLKRSVAIVGTRSATEYGKNITEALIAAWAPFDPVIISGLAYGIDIAAHKAALKYGLKTIAVMGTGADMIYPSVHKPVALDIVKQGGLLTENVFGTKPDAPRFPERNRIIAGLADATVVVEASDKGGALITAEIANSYNKEVFAVPGRIGDVYSSGCNRLIRQNKAHILSDPMQLVKELNWVEESNKKTPRMSSKNVDLNILDGETKQIMQILMQHKEILIDELAWKSGVNVNRISSILLEMEFEGLVKPLPGKKFKLID